VPRVVHFEIDAKKPATAIAFYKKVFGWKIEKWQGPVDYWLIMTGKDEPGIDGGLSERTGAKPATVNTIDVPSIDGFIKKVKANGGKITRKKGAVPGVGWLAYFKDPEGNLWGMMQNDPSAK
jgi:predicted enzyme related to lactoylglutathione lyase